MVKKVQNTHTFASVKWDRQQLPPEGVRRNKDVTSPEHAWHESADKCWPFKVL